MLVASQQFIQERFARRVEAISKSEIFEEDFIDFYLARIFRTSQ